MTYDGHLAERTRAVLDGMGLPFEEKKMFGGLAFLVNGHMAVAASGQGGLLVRADPAEGEQLISTGKADPMEMRGRPMSGWLRVRTASLGDDDLEAWVDRGVACATSLPGKA